MTAIGKTPTGDRGRGPMSAALVGGLIAALTGCKSDRGGEVDMLGDANEVLPARQHYIAESGS